MKSKVEVEELVGVLEKIRKEKHSDIPEALIREIVDAEFTRQDDRTQARKETKRLIEAFLKQVDEEV